MHFINRAVAIIRPKQPFVDWANQLRDATYEVTLEDLHEDCLAVLIPEYETNEEAKASIDKIWEALPHRPQCCRFNGGSSGPRRSLDPELDCVYRMGG